MPEEMIIQHCAPTLANLKTGSLFTYSFPHDSSIHVEMNTLNQVLNPKGIVVRILGWKKDRALLFVYRPDRLLYDFTNHETSIFMKSLGYCPNDIDSCIHLLQQRICAQNSFPHEIGIFLGYPLEDVKGFINCECCKYQGLWKVYGDIEHAKNLFQLYEKCTNEYLHANRNGISLARLSISS